MRAPAHYSPSSLDSFTRSVSSFAPKERLYSMRKHCLHSRAACLHAPQAPSAPLLFLKDDTTTTATKEQEIKINAGSNVTPAFFVSVCYFFIHSASTPLSSFAPKERLHSATCCRLHSVHSTVFIQCIALSSFNAQQCPYCVPAALIYPSQHSFGNALRHL
jgi:hypothetical protein